MKDKAYWYAKHPVVDQVYRGRPLPTGQPYEMDVRHFVWADDVTLDGVVKSRGLRKDSPDDTALAVQKLVCNEMTYVPDNELGRSEYWLFPAETWYLHRGDCEDGAILMASLLLNALPPQEHWRVRVAAGWVRPSPTAPQGGHGYMTYCRCSDNEYVPMDWCYYQDPDTPVPEKPMVKDNATYGEVWFSFNHELAWSHVKFELSGRLRDDPAPGPDGP